MGGIADAHRGRALVSRQPWHLPFGQPPLAGKPVHDLHLLRAARHRAQQPVAPGLRLVVEAGVHQREQREGGVAQPAEAVVPVADAAQLLGQRRGRRRHDPAGRPVGERLERDQRAHDRVGAVSGGPAFPGPFGPEFLGRRERGLVIERAGHRRVRRRVGEDERHRLSGRDRELADGAHVLAGEVRGRAHHHHVRARDRAQRSVLEPRDPGHDGAIPEAQHQLAAHRDPPALADHQPDHVRMAAAQRHEIDEGDGALARFEARFEDQRAVAVAPRHARPAVPRCNPPASVVLAAQERGKAGVGIEARPAQPVDRAVASDQRGRLAVADQGVVLDAGGHGRA